MAQRQFKSDDTNKWIDGFGSGKDGAYASAGNATFAAANASVATVSAGQTAITISAASTFANGDIVLIHQTRGSGAGAWELNKIKSGAGTTSIVLAYPLTISLTDSGASQAQILEIKEYSSFTQNSGHTLTVPAWDGNIGGIMAFMCCGATSIAGTLSLNGADSGYNGATPNGGGFRGGQGANDTGSNSVYCGEGTGGASAVQTTANGSGGGGGASGNGSSNDHAPGGGGGHVSAGGNGSGGTRTNGTGGSAVGTAALTNINLGAGGGGALGTIQYMSGSNGGGICIIISRTITITGTITTRPGNGSTSAYGSNGVGAGGSVLIKAQTATLGSTKITAQGRAAVQEAGGDLGGTGSDGRIHLDYLTSYTGTTTPALDATKDASLVTPGIVSAFML